MKMGYFGNFKHGSKRVTKTARVEPQPFARLTVKPPGAAGDQNVAPAPSLHVRQESLDGLDGAEEVDLQNMPH